jgi:hypothetical protein
MVIFFLGESSRSLSSRSEAMQGVPENLAVFEMKKRFKAKWKSY